MALAIRSLRSVRSSCWRPLVAGAYARTSMAPRASTSSSLSSSLSSSSSSLSSSTAGEPTELRAPGDLPKAVYQTTVEHPAGIDHSGAEDLEAKFAVVRISGKQYKVGVDDVVVVDSLRKSAEVGSEIKIEDVLLVGSVDKTVVGQPVVAGAVVTASVEEHT